jgi:hypothetical protein
MAWEKMRRRGSIKSQHSSVVLVFFDLPLIRSEREGWQSGSSSKITSLASMRP